MKRRDIIKGLAILPFAGGTVGGIQSAMAAATVQSGPLKAGALVYQSIGVEPVINCRGTFTIIGASTIMPEAKEAMASAQMHYVQLDEFPVQSGVLYPLVVPEE
jgi:D-glucosaminate-6-phosphate ammonia-lyase